MMRTMEFNIEADRAGACLRTGVRTHTLSVGDHDVTAMINGTRAELLALADKITAELVDDRPRVNENLVDRIAARAKEMGGVSPGTNIPVVSIYFSAGMKPRFACWTASVEVKAARKPNRYAYGTGHTADQAIRDLAKAVGL